MGFRRRRADAALETPGRIILYRHLPNKTAGLCACCPDAGLRRAKRPLMTFHLA
jgi:hypothetical protein